MTLEETAKSGDSRRLLEELRDRLAADIDACQSARDVASLSARLADVARRLDTLPAEIAESPLVELQRRRLNDSTAGRWLTRWPLWIPLLCVQTPQSLCCGTVNAARDAPRGCRVVDVENRVTQTNYDLPEGFALSWGVTIHGAVSVPSIAGL
jgi:hypothetical protein